MYCLPFLQERRRLAEEEKEKRENKGKGEDKAQPDTAGNNANFASNAAPPQTAAHSMSPYPPVCVVRMSVFVYDAAVVRMSVFVCVLLYAVCVCV